MNTSVFRTIEKDSAVAAIKEFKAHLSIQLLQAFRADARSDAQLARKLKLKLAQYKKLREAELSGFSLEDMITFCDRLGLQISSKLTKGRGLKYSNVLTIKPPVS